MQIQPVFKAHCYSHTSSGKTDRFWKPQSGKNRRISLRRLAVRIEFFGRMISLLC